MGFTVHCTSPVYLQGDAVTLCQGRLVGWCVSWIYILQCDILKILLINCGLPSYTAHSVFSSPFHNVCVLNIRNIQQKSYFRMKTLMEFVLNCCVWHLSIKIDTKSQHLGDYGSGSNKLPCKGHVTVQGWTSERGKCTGLKLATTRCVAFECKTGPKM